jgi:outer membrane protein TolC
VPRAPGLVWLDSPAQILRRRPDIRAAEARVAASDARIGSALAEYYPSISIAGVIGFQALDSERLFTAPALNAQGLVGLRWRLFDFARIDADVAAARARGDGAAAAYRAALLLATEDVENALFALVAREQQAREAARASVSFTSASRAAKRTFDAGITGLPQLLDAERRSLGARQDEADARLAAARAAVASFRAIGGVVGGGPETASSADPRRSQ